MKNLPTIEKFIITEDSYILAVLSDGTITNGDMTFENIEELTHPIKGVEVFEWDRDKHPFMSWSHNQRVTLIETLIEQKIIA